MKTDLFVDNDIGYMLYYSGILGFLYYLFFCIYNFIFTEKKYKYYFIFTLTMISATLVFNFKFLILFMIILSILLQRKFKYS